MENREKEIYWAVTELIQRLETEKWERPEDPALVESLDRARALKVRLDLGAG